MVFKMSWGISNRLHGYYPLLPLFKIFFLFPIPVFTLAQDCLQDKGHTEMPDFPESASFMPVPWKICHPSVVVLLSLLSLAGGLMVFTAVSKVSSTEADDDTGSQCSSFNSGVMWSHFCLSRTSHAALFWSLCDRPISSTGRPTRMQKVTYNVPTPLVSQKPDKSIKIFFYQEPSLTTLNEVCHLSDKIL